MIYTPQLPRPSFTKFPCLGIGFVALAKSDASKGMQMLVGCSSHYRFKGSLIYILFREWREEERENQQQTQVQKQPKPLRRKHMNEPTPKSKIVKSNKWFTSSLSQLLPFLPPPATSEIARKGISCFIKNALDYNGRKEERDSSCTCFTLKGGCYTGGNQASVTTEQMDTKRMTWDERSDWDKLSQSHVSLAVREEEKMRKRRKNKRKDESLDIKVPVRGGKCTCGVKGKKKKREKKEWKLKHQ